ncbi:helix-turn-helix transcriptional regulator [Slackia heliotrinireducens]|uniref:helix-turn-helix transcriptional regulator n=1 Tax=Slackia heliotrinireducens TaxID=84110 RepID=UPI003314EB81
MSFRNNLQYLRSTRSMTQEQLAMMVGVSRQSVTKWESERAYPEMDKLLKISQIFDCTIDELVQGDLTHRDIQPEKAMPVDMSSDSIGYVDRFKVHARLISIGVGCFIIGCGLGLLLTGLLQTMGFSTQVEILLPILVLAFVIAGLAFVIPESTRHTLFMKEHPYIIDFFSSEERMENGVRTSRGIVLGTGIILASLILVFVFGERVDGIEPLEEIVSGIMLIGIAVGVGFIVYFGILSDMTNIAEYNVSALCELTDEEAVELLDDRDASERERLLAKRRINKIVGASCGITMIVATIAGLALLFSEFEFFWMAWCVGGLICAVIAIVGSILAPKPNAA